MGAAAFDRALGSVAEPASRAIDGGELTPAERALVQSAASDLPALAARALAALEGRDG
jgi:hypothetical protein